MKRTDWNRSAECVIAAPAMLHLHIFQAALKLPDASAKVSLLFFFKFGQATVMKTTELLIFGRISQAKSATEDGIRTGRLLSAVWISVVAVVAVIFGVLAVSCSRADEPDVRGSGTEAIEKHGPAQVLAETLLRVREQELLLQSVRIDADGLYTNGSLEALQQIFAYPTDVFRFDPNTSSPSGVHQQALRQLLSSSHAAQRQWMQTMTVLADTGFRQAISTGDRSALSRVAREFPLTESGIRAAVLTLTTDFLSGRCWDVEQRLRQLLADYAGTILDGFVLNVSKSLLEKTKISISSNGDALRTSQPDGTEHPTTQLSLSTT
ncbi:MAG: hypothetical protein U0936_22355, partial [Planctomycetaceae bacterium]